jgi:hypothetical protein
MRGKNIPRWINDVKYGSSCIEKQLIPDNIRFNLDHPYRIGKRSFVAYPYHIDVEEIEPFRLWLQSKGYTLHIEVGSEYHEYTFKILLIHNSEEHEWWNMDFSEVTNAEHDNKLYWKLKDLMDKKNEVNL